MKNRFATLVISLGLCCAGALAKPNPSGPVDPRKFEEYQAKAVTGDADAQIALGDCNLEGKGVKQDDAEAVAWFRKAAEQGEAIAQFNLGRGYLLGGGVEQDSVESYKWILLAEAQGFDPARRNAAAMERQLTREQVAEGQQRASTFESVDASPLSLIQAGPGGRPPAKLLANAVGGDPAAQHELGMAFQTGKQGVGKHPMVAVKWFKMAAAQNFVPAQISLGFCYERGDGIPKHELEAYKWYLLAAAQGDAKAKDHADLVELGLSSNQIAEGKRRAENFKPQERPQP